MQKNRDYELTDGLLQEYMNCSLRNAEDLLGEADILLSKMRYARSYFLACAAIEEVGKAYSAFSARSRNLHNLGTANTIKKSFEDHRSKIISAFICYLSTDGITKEKTSLFLQTVPALEAGREKSMYVDISERSQVMVPEAIVRPIVAVDTVRLAKLCFETTKTFVLTRKPWTSTPSQDKLICLETKKLTSIFESQDFWQFCQDQMEKSAGFDYVEMAVRYHDEYFAKKSFYARQEAT
jgi:AbiV family abortive infection protein